MTFDLQFADDLDKILIPDGGPDRDLQSFMACVLEGTFFCHHAGWASK